MKDVLLAAAMAAGVVVPACAPTDQIGDHGIETKAHIALRRFVRAVGVVRLLPTYNAQARECGA
jgi:hypothetical protein